MTGSSKSRADRLERHRKTAARALLRKIIRSLSPRDVALLASHGRSLCVGIAPTPEESEAMSRAASMGYTEDLFEVAYGRSHRLLDAGERRRIREELGFYARTWDTAMEYRELDRERRERINEKGASRTP